MLFGAYLFRLLASQGVKMAICADFLAQLETVR